MSARLHVGLDLVTVGAEPGGIGRYAAELVPALLAEEPRTDLTLFVTRRFPRSLRGADWAGDVRWVAASFRTTRVPLHMPYQQLALPLRRAVRGLDVIHGVANSVPLVTPGVRRVLTLHDVIWIHHPDVIPSRARRAIMHAAAIAGARRADRVLTDSHASRDDLVVTAGLDGDRIDVAPLGIRDRRLADPTPRQELRQRFGLGARRVVLCVAQTRPHKNQTRLIRAFAALGRADACLVLAGESPDGGAALRETAAREAPGAAVRVLGWVSEADLAGLYREADCLVLPSLREGFGLPVLEAMSYGVPVACSDIPALRELAGDAALRFDPRDEVAIAGAVERLLEDGRTRATLTARGRARCRRYPWGRTARATLASYRRALDEPARPRLRSPQWRAPQPSRSRSS